MDSEGSSPSDDSQSSSESSDGGSSGPDEERLEPATILGNAFELPRDLCEDPDIFRELFSMKTWETLSESETDHLKRFLPAFSENDAEEKNLTIEKLFARETFNFTSPLVEFHQKLRDGAFRPDIARMHKVLQKARRHHSRHQWRAECYKTMQEVLVCRERLLALAHSAAPGSNLPHAYARTASQNSQAPTAPALHLRAKRRYFQELAAIRSEVCGGDGDGQPSEDENFPDGPPAQHSSAKQHRRQPSHSQGGTATMVNGNFPPLTEEWRRKALAAHRLRRAQQPDHPELNTAGITLGCVRGRCGGVSAVPAEGGGGRARRPPRPRAPPPPAPPAPPIRARTLSPHPRSRPQRRPDSPSDEESSVPASPAPPPPPLRVVVDPLPPLVRALPTPQPAPPPPPPPQEQPVLGEDLGVELVQATHACFLSVVRDLVCGTPRHCLPLPQLAARLRRWRQNPIAPLNHWYSGAEDWVKALPSAVAFLAGEGESAPSPDDFVPYLQYKPATQVYQWIGAGRDSDALLAPLCTAWLARRQAAEPATRTQQPTPVTAPAAPQRPVALGRPDRWPKDEGSELESFRSQERARFQRPHRAFTYCLPEAAAVVGPLKGVYACEENGGGRGARGHSLLASARPRHVTLLALVRDAVACLPDGEGTRAHITALLRRSQYLVSDAGEQALQAAVSGALDRMHCAPDPCVRYLPARKLWLYLHRDRTEEEFERLHAEVQGKSTAKGKGGPSGGGGGGTRRAGGARVAPSDVAIAAPAAPARTQAASPRRRPLPSPSRSVNVNVSPADDEDANVDVEGTEPPLSPALSVSPPPPSPPIRVDATSAAVSSIAGIPLQRTVTVAAPVEKIAAVTPNVSVAAAGFLNTIGTPIAVSIGETIRPQGVRQPPGATARSVVRVLSPAAPGKSLISPRALRPSTPPPIARVGTGIGTVTTTQAKVVVQRAGARPHSTGALPLSHQRILLESLMQHQRTHGQPMSHDQLLHTIHSTQKLSSSPPITPGGAVATPRAQQTVRLSGQTVQLASGQTVQLTGQTVQLTGQTVRLTGQTVQLGGQTVRLADPTLRPQQKQSGPLMAKILTSAQTSVSSAGGPSITEGVSLASSLSHPQPQPHHTLLLSNLGGQVVRVASGGGTLLGPALRLQAASPSTHLAQARAGGVTGASVLLGGQALKLQAGPVRLHHQGLNANAGGVAANLAGSRVVLAGGARLHGLKLLPMHHTIRGVGAGRQVYARIVTPASSPRPLPPQPPPSNTSISADPAPPETPRTQ